MFVFFYLQCCSSVNPFSLAVAPKILEALQIAETYMEKTENFSGKVRSVLSVFFILILRKVLCTFSTGFIKATKSVLFN